MGYEKQSWENEYVPDCQECASLLKKYDRLKLQLFSLENEARAVLALIDDWRARGKLEIDPVGPGAKSIERLRTGLRPRHYEG